MSMAGLKHSEETKRKISKSHEGIKPTKETRIKLSIVHRGIRPSKKTRKKMSEKRTKPLKYIIDKNECFLVISHKSDKSGYIRLKNKGIHRIIYEIYLGSIPEGMCICHRCDVRNCINPDHLFLGTRGDNNRDAIKKGRGVCGENNGNAKLTEEIVKKIRGDKISTHAELGRKYGVSEVTIGYVRKKTIWKHVT